MVEDGWTLMRTPCLWYVEEIGDSGGVCKVFFLCKHKLIKSAYLIFKKLCVLFKLYITANFTAASWVLEEKFTQTILNISHTAGKINN